ncbi:hypothetical protein PBI_DRMANHATTAN_56 [Arthrobacter phage DrManhattan]|uniref:Uncharacterized protein n=1 Tax=Arthrobacter phage DrManhattan TaxID=2419955 RepID=A0A3G2KFS5_9CAUD|nr:hypothetical protein HOU48_gp56 [Arthrobacter phage DrManhattan]AYN57791.1 hypothetical protein PBI_DRMANHATTAN_56 [Arthrobacter phage DrManhattan]
MIWLDLILDLLDALPCYWPSLSRKRRK